MSGATPKVSVIMPAYNAARFIRESVESVLNQSYDNVELVVIDDGSTDGTVEALGAFHGRINLVKQSNGGPSAARNRGLETATGDYVCFLDADDLMSQGALTALVKRATMEPRIDVTVGCWQTVDENGRPTAAIQDPEGEFRSVGYNTVKAFQIRCCWPVFAALTRSEAIRKCGGWDERLQAAEDQDLWLRLAIQGCQVGFVKVLVASYRLHTTNASLDVKRQQGSLEAFLEKWYGAASPLSPEAKALRPYACASFWFYLAQKSWDARMEVETRRLIRMSCEALAGATPDDVLMNRVLWDVYKKPWERTVHTVLWPKAAALVGDVCWAHFRVSCRRWKLLEAGAWGLTLAREQPSIFFRKFRHAWAGQFRGVGRINPQSSERN